jgi:hypothetical protein
VNDGPDRDGELVIPGFQTGGVVRETGIALVHEGEWILPAAGSEARIEPGEMNAGGAVEYHFPVEVVVTGAVSEGEIEAIERRIFGALAEAFDRLG